MQVIALLNMFFQLVLIPLAIWCKTRKKKKKKKKKREGFRICQRAHCLGKKVTKAIASEGKKPRKNTQRASWPL
jgi:hypothetical protein